MREEAGGEEWRARGSKPPCLRRHRICIACPSMDIESRSNARHQQEAAHWERERAAPTLTTEKTIFVASDPHHLPPYPDMVGSAALKHPRRSRPDLPLARATLNPRASPPHLYIRRRQLHRPYLRSPRVLTATFNSLEVRRQWNSATRKRVGGGTRRWRGDRAIRDGRLACVGYQQPLHLEREVWKKGMKNMGILF